MSLFNRKRTPEEQTGYEQYMEGFRAGCPAPGDQPGATDPSNSEYQRGLVAGERIMQGLCPGCGKGTPAGNNVYCYNCMRV
jgi:hypothetical protein